MEGLRRAVMLAGGQDSEADSQRWGSRGPAPPPQPPPGEPSGPPPERKRLVLAPRTKPVTADAPTPEDAAEEKPKKVSTNDIMSQLYARQKATQSLQSLHANF